MRTKRYRLQGKRKWIIILTVLAVILTYFAYPHFYSTFINVRLNPKELMEIASHRSQGVFSGAFEVYENQLLNLEKTGLKLFDREGNIIWNSPIKSGTPFLGMLKDCIVAADMDKGIVYGVNNEGKTVWSYESGGRISRVGADKNFMWIKAVHDGNNIVEIVNQKGEKTASLAFGKEEITGVSVSPDGEYVAVCTLGIQGRQLVSSLGYYRKDGAIRWAQKYNDIIILALRITDKGDILVLNEERVISLSNKGDIQWYHKLKGYVTKVLLSPRGFSLIATADDYGSGLPGSMDEKTLLFDGKGVIKGTYHLNGRIAGLAEGEGHAALFASREMKLIDLQGNEKAYMKFDRDVSRVFLLGDMSLAYVSGGDTYFSKIK